MGAGIFEVLVLIRAILKTDKFHVGVAFPVRDDNYVHISDVMISLRFKKLRKIRLTEDHYTVP